MFRYFTFLMFLFSTRAIASPVFPLPLNYEDYSGLQKHLFLWANIMRSQYPTNPSLQASVDFQKLVGLFNLAPSFDHTSDEMPEGRKKFIHTYGSVASCTFVPHTNSPYTGIFRGASCLARLSLAGDPQKIGFTPGMGVKFFIDGKPSVNIQVMNSVEGQGQYTNFFAKNFSNKIPPPTSLPLKILGKWFALVKSDPNSLPLGHLSQIKANGEAEEDPTIAEQIWFVPVIKVTEADIALQQKDFREYLAKIPSGTVLYQVFANQEAGQDPQLIGELRIDTQFIASYYGDEKLFFKHPK